MLHLELHLTLLQVKWLLCLINKDFLNKSFIESLYFDYDKPIWCIQASAEKFPGEGQQKKDRKIANKTQNSTIKARIKSVLEKDVELKLGSDTKRYFKTKVNFCLQAWLEFASER